MNGDGPTDAWVAETVARFEAPLMRYAVSLTRDPDTARDVVQDTFVRLWQADRSRIGDRTAPWLYTVCRNRAFDVMRKERRMQRLARPPEPAVDPEALAELGEKAATVARALAALPEAQQEVVRLKFQAGLSYREIGEVTGHSVSNVGYLLHVALSTVRSRMATEMEGSL